MGICCNTGKEDRMCCVPLATGAIIWAVLLIVVNAVMLGVHSTVFSLVNCIVGLCVFALVLVGIILGTCAQQQLIGSIFLKIGTVYCVVDAVWKFITVILLWVFFAALTPEFRSLVLVIIIIQTLLAVAAACIELSIANGFLSLSFVYDVGGRGMDYQNYLEVKKGKANDPEEVQVPMTTPTQVPAASEPAPPPPPPAAAEYVQPMSPVQEP